MMRPVIPCGAADATPMPIVSDHALVIRLTEYSETSQIVTLFARQHGQVRLIGKGLRRGTRTRPAVGLDLLEAGEAAFVPAREHAGLGVLTEWLQAESFGGLRRSLPRLYGGLYLAELLATLTVEADANPALYDHALGTLHALADQAPVAETIVAFQRSMLEDIGFQPNLEGCVICGKSRPAGRAASFSPQAGGLLCASCAPRHTDRMRVSAAVLDQPLAAHAREWLALLHHHLRHLAGREIRTGLVLSDALRKSAP